MYYQHCMCNWNSVHVRVFDFRFSSHDKNRYHIKQHIRLSSWALHWVEYTYLVCLLEYHNTSSLSLGKPDYTYTLGCYYALCKTVLYLVLTIPLSLFIRLRDSTINVSYRFNFHLLLADLSSEDVPDEILAAPELSLRRFERTQRKAFSSWVCAVKVQDLSSTAVYKRWAAVVFWYIPADIKILNIFIIFFI